MPKIAIIGAGSRVFAQAMIRDSLTFPALEGATISLMDIDAAALKYVTTIAEKIVAQGEYPAKIEATTNRAKALKGADYVVVAILAGGRKAIHTDIDIPMKYGIDQCIGDTMGPGGIFRAARTIPVMVDIARDMEKLCPDAVMLNYTNPMYMLCRAMHRTSSTRLVGLCHSVQGSAGHLARIMKVDFNDCDYWVAGINHQAWFLEYKHKGKDVLPRIRKAARDNNGWWQGDTTRVEMCRHLGHYVTESSGHNSEYNPWFRKTSALTKKYTPGGSWNGGSGFIKEIYSTDRKTYMKWMRDAAAAKEFDLARGQEYGSYIMNALEGGGDFRFNGTVPNTSLIDNLPPESAVEVPILAEKQRLRPCHVGSLPPQCAALNNQVVSSLELAVDAILEGDRDKLFWSIAYDPLTAAVLSLEDIRKMVDELYRAEKHLMPTFGGKAKYKLVGS